MKWTIIRYLAGNKFIRGAYVFLIAVPIIARLFAKIENPIIITLKDYVLKLDFSLPFTWTVFYFAAMLFTLGEVFYSIFAPKMILQEKSLSTFLEQKKGFNHLKYYLSDIKKGVKGVFNKAILIEPINSKLKDSEKLYESTLVGEYLYKEYYSVYNFLDRSSPFVRILISSLFVLGLLFIGFNMYENFLFVTDQIRLDD